MFIPGLPEAYAKAHELLVCRCRHTGEFRVISRVPDDHCEKCTPDTCQPMTRASVQGAFNYYAEQMDLRIARERWIASFHATEAQRDWLRAHPDYELVEPRADCHFESVGTLYKHGGYERGNAFAGGHHPGSLAVGIKRKV